ncbi:MAG TPA: hypothetical protein VGA69_01955 [Nitriliruptorales bacterium]
MLPSALNVPQSNPSQTLEFAPVPAEDDQPPPPAGNTASLGLGSSSNAPGDALGTDGGPPPPLPPPPLPDGEGATPVTKRCVGNPPRQSEDPMAPPCVAHFEGDNFGATYRGVTGEEIRVLFYLHGDRCEGATARGFECPVKGVVHDLDAPPQNDDHSSIRFLRAYLNYFNARYQLYDRRAHGFVYYDTGSTEAPATAESRRADAAELSNTVQPFAVLPYAITFNVEFLEAMAARDHLVFGTFGARPADFYRTFPGRVWGNQGTIERQASLFSSYVCTKVVPHPASFSGNAGENGQPRKLGLLKTTDASKASFLYFAQVAQPQIEDCGGDLSIQGTYPQASNTFDAANREPATRNIANFAAQGVTTIVRMQGLETAHSNAAGVIGYEPEWVLAGDRQTEGWNPMQFQDRDVWSRHAWVVSDVPLTGPSDEAMCYRSLEESEPGMPDQDKSWVCSSRTYYQDLQLLFTAIQTAGPRLTPDTIDRGLHAIPPVRSTDPAVPACFYDPGDYTCIKDAAVSWWDFEAQRGSAAQSDGGRGCWRMGEGGQRYLPGGWPEGDVLTMQSETDPCNLFFGSASGGS